MELSPIIPLLAGLDPKQREICVSAGAMVKRQQSAGRWGGNLVVATMDRNQVLLLPTLPIESKSIKAMGLVKIMTTHHPDTCAMIYEDQHGAAWCIRLSGPGLPVIQDDLFRNTVRLAVLV